MTTIVTRASNGAPLTNTQMDTNLTNLNNDKLELSGGTVTGQIKGITPVSAEDLTRKDYVDSLSAGVGPAFRAQATTSQNISANSTTNVTLGTESFDTNSCFTSNTFTPNVAGYYQINCGVRGVATTNVPALPLSIFLKKNGSIIYESRTEMTPSSNYTYYNTAQLSDIVYLNGTTDSIVMAVKSEYAFQVGSLYYEHMTYMSGCLVRRA